MSQLCPDVAFGCPSEGVVTEMTCRLQKETNGLQSLAVRQTISHRSIGLACRD
jgi:hypothetical protein